MNKASDINRIKKMIDILGKSAEGDYSLRIADSGNDDELDKLADAINQVLEQISSETSNINIDGTGQSLFISKSNLLQSLIDSLEYGLTIQDREYNIIFQNEYMIRVYGYSRGKCYNIYEFNENICEGCPVKMSFEDKLSHTTEREVLMPSGNTIIWENTATPIKDSKENIIACLEVVRDITERKHTEAALKDSEAKYRTVVESSLVGVYIIQDGLFRFVNNRFCEISGYTYEELIDKLGPMDTTLPEERNKVQENIRKRLSGEKKEIEYRTKAVRKDGKIVDVRIFGSRLEYNGKPAISGTIIDITEHLELEAKLRQSQKMDSIGRLAGGVAHDFNNMLNVILGYTELALDSIDPSQSVYSNLKEIFNAATRSSEIVRQLLAFARKQTFSPKVLDLNNTIENMIKILKHTIGEDIDIAWKAYPDLWPVKMDPVQIEQVLINLCLNARDAISGTGKITIETGNAVFDENYCAEHSGSVPGEYSMLAVSDTGCGMEKDVLDNIFEPFFSTKGIDKGTGLGLATVFGIVKQNNGFINVYSELNSGTLFKIYIPRYTGQAEEEGVKTAAEPPVSRGETILVVEDEQMALQVIKMMLEAQKYRVLAAHTPGEAIRLGREHSGGIDLLITDVIMPEMNGKELANQLNEMLPGIKCLFMSGYTANVIAHRGMLVEGVNFIQKPFSSRSIGLKIREVLDKE